MLLPFLAASLTGNPRLQSRGVMLYFTFRKPEAAGSKRLSCDASELGDNGARLNTTIVPQYSGCSCTTQLLRPNLEMLACKIREVRAKTRNGL